MYYVFAWDTNRNDDPVFRSFALLVDAKAEADNIVNGYDHVIITKEIGCAVRSIQMRED